MKNSRHKKAKIPKVPESVMKLLLEFTDESSEEESFFDDPLVIVLIAILGGIPVFIICLCCFRACFCKVHKDQPSENLTFVQPAPDTQRSY